MWKKMSLILLMLLHWHRTVQIITTRSWAEKKIPSCCICQLVKRSYIYTVCIWQWERTTGPQSNYWNVRVPCFPLAPPTIVKCGITLQTSGFVNACPLCAWGRLYLPVCVLTDGDRSFSSQQQFETLAVVGQAAVMQRCASSGRLLVQVNAETHAG